MTTPTEQIQAQPAGKDVKQILAELSEKFPLCFSQSGEAKPLKIGIFQDLAQRLSEEDGISKTQIRHALRLYTSSWRYLHGVKAGAIRVDLDGNPAGELTEEHVTHARQALKDSKDKVFASRRRPEADKAARPRKPARPKIDPSKLVNGQKVKVVVGKAPVPATVREVARDDIQVELATGMVVRVKADRLILQE